MSYRKARKKRSLFPWRVHPIWRGIGCLFLIIVPIISLGLADLLLAQIKEPLPEILARPMTLPSFGVVDSFLGIIFIALIISVGLFLLFSIIGSIVYSLLGGREQEKQADYLKRDPFKR